ncbi:hypothetical protein HC123_12485, partial [Lactobacillus crispatus]|nr:hypothetical protein [Lactobacillus crispatus]
LYSVTYDVNGVDDATIAIGSTKDKLADQNISIGRSEFAHCDPENVEVDLIGL